MCVKCSWWGKLRCSLFNAWSYCLSTFVLSWGHWCFLEALLHQHRPPAASPLPQHGHKEQPLSRFLSAGADLQQGPPLQKINPPRIERMEHIQPWLHASDHSQQLHTKYWHHPCSSYVQHLPWHLSAPQSSTHGSISTSKQCTWLYQHVEAVHMTKHGFGQSLQLLTITVPHELTCLYHELQITLYEYVLIKACTL